MMQYELRVAGHGVTDVGKVRSKNEDSLLLLDRQLVYCVADGMGGVSGGEIASQKVVQCINDQVGGLDESVSLNERMLCIHQAAIEANKSILEWSEKNEVQGAGTTLVLLVLSKEYPWAVNILHAGDSRAYRYRGGELKQISVDHSIEQAVGENSGQPLPSQFKGLITNAVGLKKSLSLELTHADQMAGDTWLLCSDGLDKMLSDEAIAAVLSTDDDADVLAQRLVDDANAAGGKDNVSVVIVKVLECSSQPEGAVSIPFPGPLPGVVEDDETTSSTETSMTAALSMDTETNGSSMTNMETPDSETDFLSHEGEGLKSHIHWLVLVLVGVVIVFVLWKIISGNKAPVVAEAPGETEIQAAAPADTVGSVDGVESAVDLKEIVASAERSGDWKLAYVEMQEGNYSNTDENVKNEKIIDNWYRKVWAEANENPDKAKEAMAEFIAAANRVLVSIGRNTLPASISWSNESTSIATEFSRRRYDLQQVTLKEVDGFRAFNERRINYMGMLPDEQVAAAFRVAGLDGRKYKEFDRLLHDAEYAVQELDRWLRNVGSSPITMDQVESLPDSYIKYCDRVDVVADELAAALRSKPELKNNVNVESESVPQAGLKYVQDDWKSIQNSLKKLVSGKLSAGEEESIRQYLEGLFRFEQMVGAGKESFE